MDPHLVGRALAVIWIAVSLWIGGVNTFILFLLLAGTGQQGDRPLSMRDELGIVLFFVISGTVAATWAFDSTANLPRNIGYMVSLLALWLLPAIFVRLRSRLGRS
jgi:hypothetical protein